MILIYEPCQKGWELVSKLPSPSSSKSEWSTHGNAMNARSLPIAWQVGNLGYNVPSMCKGRSKAVFYLACKSIRECFNDCMVTVAPMSCHETAIFLMMNFNTLYRKISLKPNRWFFHFISQLLPTRKKQTCKKSQVPNSFQDQIWMTLSDTIKR